MANGRGCRPKVCKDCGALDIDGYVISFRGLCSGCAERRQTDSARQMHEGAGEYAERWKAAMRESLAERLEMTDDGSVVA